MTRSDSNSSDQSANQDDAVWLDLVSRLEGTDTPAPAGDGSEPHKRPFRDFDPLGLAGSAPTEPSAAERGAAVRAPQPGADNAGADRAEPASGPRDYEADDDEPFVPEEPRAWPAVTR